MIPSTDPRHAQAFEAELIVRLRKGDQGAFTEIFHRYKNRVYTICRRMAGSAADAEDLAQSAFLQMVERIDALKEVNSFRGWFDRLTVNVVLGQLRARKRLVLLDGEGWDRLLGSSPSQAIAPAPPEAADLDRALATLPEGARAVFLLYLVHGYTHEEIAEQLGCTVGTTKTQLHRARRRLMELLG